MIFIPISNINLLVRLSYKGKNGAKLGTQKMCFLHMPGEENSPPGKVVLVPGQRTIICLIVFYCAVLVYIMEN